MKKKIIGMLIVLSVSSLILFNKEHLRKINIIINSITILFFITDSIINDYKIKLNSIIVTYFFFFLFSLLSLLWTINFTQSFSLNIRIFSLFLMLVSLYNLTSKYNLHKYILYGLFVGALFNYFLLFSSLGLEIYNKGRFQGSLNNSNALARVMILSIYFSVLNLYGNRKWYLKLLYFLNAVMSFYIIIITVSRMGVLLSLFIIGLAIILSFKKPIKAFISFSLLLLLLWGMVRYFGVNRFEIRITLLINRFVSAQKNLTGRMTENKDRSVVERYKYVNLGIDIFKESPVLGKGVGIFIILEGGHYSHNNYIEILSGVGIIGLLIYYLIYLLLFYKIYLINTKNKLFFYSFLLILFFSDFGTVIYYSRMDFMLIVYIMVIVENNKNILIKDKI